MIAWRRLLLSRARAQSWWSVELPSQHQCSAWNLSLHCGVVLSGGDEGGRCAHQRILAVTTCGILTKGSLYVHTQLFTCKLGDAPSANSVVTTLGCPFWHAMSSYRWRGLVRVGEGRREQDGEQ